MNDRGMILISVLWVVLVISLVAFSLAASVRVEAQSELGIMDSEKAFFMARGAAEVVYSKFAAKEDFPDDSPVVVDNGEYVFTFDSGEARVRFESGDGLIDLNAASDHLLAAAFDSLGIGQEQRNRVVDSILDWRDSDDIPHLYGAEVNDYAGGTPPRNGPFGSVDELLLVKNMTPELFNGTVVIDSTTGAYRRVPGIRELLTIASHREQVNPNTASAGVLRALPGMTPSIAEGIEPERKKKRFSNMSELVQRIPGLADTDALQYLSLEPLLPAAIVSRATVAASGVSRTVRLLFKREEKIQYLTFSPLLYKKVEQVTFDRWQYQ